MARKVVKERVWAIKDHIKSTSKYSIRDYLTQIGKWSGEEMASGSNVKIHCPFHKDKTPSCYVNDVDKIWNCFSCGRHGDYIALQVEISKVVLGNSAGYYQIVNNILAEDQAMQLMLGYATIFSDVKKDFSSDFRRPRFVPSRRQLYSYPELADRMIREGITDIADIRLAILHMQDGIHPETVYEYVTGIKELREDEDGRDVAFEQLNLLDMLGGD